MGCAKKGLDLYCILVLYYIMRKHNPSYCSGRGPLNVLPNAHTSQGLFYNVGDNSVFIPYGGSYQPLLHIL